jgi:hypothetical protein
VGHTQAKDLKDLAKELSEVRALEGLTEKSPGIFYYKSIGFLHFHDKDGRRWADVKTSNGWQEIEIDFGATKGDRAIFIKKVIDAYQRFIKRK